MIDRLARRAFDARRTASRSFGGVVVDPAVPILYFGDLEAYLASSLRVITVALNPSRAEFPTVDPFSRFPMARSLSAPSMAYCRAMNAYFRTNPYVRWFSSFEALLNGMGVSYYPVAQNIALHTDLCSPVATDPTWSRLPLSVQSALIETGAPLWHDLVAELRPDVILISVARHHLGMIQLPTLGSHFELARLEEGRRYPYVTDGWRVRLVGDHCSLLVFGRAAHQPFGPVSDRYKGQLGQLVRLASSGGGLRAGVHSTSERVGEG